jgi:hypothetical protein
MGLRRPRSMPIQQPFDSLRLLRANALEQRKSSWVLQRAMYESKAPYVG